MKLSIIDLRLFPKPGPIAPELLGPHAYILVDHVHVRGTFPVKELLSADSLAALAKFANRLEKTRNAHITKDVAVRHRASAVVSR